MKLTVWGGELAAWVAAAQLATYGNEVTICADLQATDDAVSLVPAQSSLRSEPGLMDLIRQAEASGRLRPASRRAALDAPVHWLALSPAERDDATSLVGELACNSELPLLVVNQSNFGIGASDQLQALLDSGAGQAVICLPDTLQQGQALAQFGQPGTLLVGCEDEGARKLLQALLRPFSGGMSNLQLMSRREAEFTKFAITGMLALRLGYINELANLADVLGVDIEVVRQGMGTDARIGQHYLAPGCGFGGQQFTQYIEGLAELMSEKRRSTLLDAVLVENRRQMELPFRKLWQHYGCELGDKTVTLWGLAFKPGVTSIDNAPALRIIEALLAQGAQLRLHDPEALAEVRAHYGDHPQLTYCEDPYSALDASDALVLITEWQEYWSPDFGRIRESMRTPLVVDGRNVFDPGMLRELGFDYYGIGRV